MTHCTTWPSTLTALLTPTIAAIVAWIYFRQWKTAQNKLKLDLFDKRVLIFDAANVLILNSQKPGGATTEEMARFLASTSQAKWLFNEEIARYLREVIYAKAIQVIREGAELSVADSGEARIEKTKTLMEAQNDILNQFAMLEKKFTPFLKLIH